jgi:hypothetical protein
MEYLGAHQSFKLTYRKCPALSNGLTGFADPDWAMSLSRRCTTGNSLNFVPLQSPADLLAFEDDCSLNGGGGVRPSIQCGC